MKRIRCICLVFVLLMPICHEAAGAGEKLVIAYTDPLRWRINDEKLIHVTVAAVYAFDDVINNLTGGGFEVDFKHSGVLGGQIETIEQVLTGAIQATTPAIPALAGYFPNIQILSIPYLWDNPAVAWEVLDGQFGQKLFDRMAKESGLRVISIFDNGGYRSFTNNVRPIRKPADMKGIKIRAMESPTQMKIIESLGGSPTPIAWRELYSCLQTGVVDGQENSPATIINGSLHEVQKYYTLDQHTLSLAVIVVAEDWFQGLAEDMRTKIRIAGRIASVAGRGTAWTNNKLALGFLAEHGMEIHHPTPPERAEFKKLAQPGVLDWMRKNRRIDNDLIDGLLDAVEKAEKSLGMP